MSIVIRNADLKDPGWARTIFLRELMRVHRRQWSALFAVIMVSLISTTLFFIISNKTHFYEWIRNKIIICISFTTIFEIWVEKIWFVYFYDTCSVKAILPAKYCCYVSSLYKHCRLFFVKNNERWLHGLQKCKLFYDIILLKLTSNIWRQIKDSGVLFSFYVAVFCFAKGSFTYVKKS